MSKIRIIKGNCVGCGECQNACLYNSIQIVDKVVKINDSCIDCGACVEACIKYGALEQESEEIAQNGNNGYSGIAIYAEQKNGKLHSVVPELIGRAMDLRKELGDRIISVVLLGDKVKNIAEEILSFGVDKVLLLDKPGLSFVNEDSQAIILAEIIKKLKPEIFLGGATNLGRSIFPRVAAKLLTGLTADCTELSVDKKTKILKQTRPAFGGQVMATIATNDCRPQMATIRPNVFTPARKDCKCEGEIININMDVPVSSIELLEYKKEEKKTKTLEDVNVVIAVGRGINGFELLPQISELADKLHGVVGASRAAVDAGWISYQNQIGQTGKTVKPTLYFAFGISGAIQHIIGMSHSNIIVAVNIDPNANIFKIADCGIVGDVFDVIPEMVRQLNKSGI